MVKRLFVICAVLVGLVSVSKSALADLNQGWSAYKDDDFELALKEWTPLAVHGDAEAQFLVGSMYDKGEGVPQDQKTAAVWFQLAADQGHVFAQYNLGLSYQYGQGVPKDYVTALIWYKLAAEHGDFDSGTNLPVMYAMFNLGVMYANGEGVAQDYVRAYMWWSICASMGNEDARKNLATIELDLSSTQLEVARWHAREWVKDYMQ